MNYSLTIQKDHKYKQTAILKTLSLEDLNAIIQLQGEVCAALSHQYLYVPFSKDEMIYELSSFPTHTIGFVTDTNELIALGIYKTVGNSPDNYGCHYGLAGDILNSIGHIDTTIVAPSFRGNKLQKHLILAMEGIARKEGKKTLCATVSPDNYYSLNTFLNLGYQIKANKLMYGGLRRYVLAKDLD